jgi:hypothetical protein
MARRRNRKLHRRKLPRRKNIAPAVAGMIIAAITAAVTTTAGFVSDAIKRGQLTKDRQAAMNPCVADVDNQLSVKGLSKDEKKRLKDLRDDYVSLKRECTKAVSLSTAAPDPMAFMAVPQQTSAMDQIPTWVWYAGGVLLLLGVAGAGYQMTRK